MALPLSYEQFSHGWQAVFVALRPEVIDIMHKLREQGHRVVVLSNTNRLHTTFWPDEYPEIRQAADHIYLSGSGHAKTGSADLPACPAV